jgi:hypothetical protein
MPDRSEPLVADEMAYTAPAYRWYNVVRVVKVGVIRVTLFIEDVLNPWIGREDICQGTTTRGYPFCPHQERGAAANTGVAIIKVPKRLG